MSEEECFLRAVKKAMLALGLLALAMMYGCLPDGGADGSQRREGGGSPGSLLPRALAKSNQVAQDTKPCAMGERPLRG